MVSTISNGFPQAPRLRCRLLLSAAILGGALTTPVGKVAAQGGIQIEEITVTARRRSESLQDVPISISAFTGGQLQARGVEDVSQVGDFTPNLTFDPTAPVSGSSIASTVFIRGVGQTDFTLNSDPGVGIYIDGVYIARSVGGLLDLVDIERVEVLRGPQGTLFGKNTIGGAINITTRAPSPDAGGYAEVRIGNFNRTDVEASFDAPLADKLLTSFAASYQRQDGYQERVLLDESEELGNTDRFTARGRIRWLPTEALSVDLSVDYSRGREQSTAQSLLAVEPNTGAPFIPAANGLIPGTVPTLDPRSATELEGSQFDERFISDDPRETFQTGPSRSDFDIWGVSLTAEWQLDAFTVKSITAYRDLESEFARDGDGSPFVVAHTLDVYEQEQISQELQLLGTGLDDRLDWVGGLFYFGEQGRNLNTVPTSIGALQSGGDVDNDTYAVFGQATYDATEALSLTLGLRYTDETKRFTPGFPPPTPQTLTQNPGSNFNGLALGLPPVLPLVAVDEFSTDAQELDINAVVQYRWTPGLMTYASYSTGFKSGGFSQRIGPSGASPLPAPPDFEPEEVRVYELGFKWDGLDNRLRVNGAAFYSDYDDIQVTPLFEGIGPVTRNAGEARIVGGELEAQFVPNEFWTADLGVGILDTKYTELSPEVQVNTTIDGELLITEDTELANAPTASVNASVERRLPLEGLGELSARLDWTYTSPLFNDVLNSPELRRDTLHLIGANVGFTSANGLWQVSLLGRNLTDEDYIISGNAERFAGNIGYTQGVFARPREVWARIRRNF